PTRRSSDLGGPHRPGYRPRPGLRCVLRHLQPGRHRRGARRRAVPVGRTLGGQSILPGLPRQHGRHRRPGGPGALAAGRGRTPGSGRGFLSASPAVTYHGCCDDRLAFKGGPTVTRRRVLILGAAGRDFHNFNMVYRNHPDFEVVGFTATQIPDIAGRRYPAVLAGELYPDGIPIYDEADLADLVPQLQVDEVVLAYSDISHLQVMHLASIALAAGADFTLLGPNSTMLESRRPVVAICAVRTGAGKSQTSRKVVEILQS